MNLNLIEKEEKFNPKNLLFSMLILMLLLCFTEALESLKSFPDVCMDGYYGQPDNCIPCDSSCKTCSDGTSCDSCEDYMFISLYTNLCQQCAEGEYYDITMKMCRSCQNQCNNECGYQAFCFECLPDEIFDIESLKCIKECNPNTLQINSNQANLPAICKTLSIYIDPLSDKFIELGTRKYPFRTFQAAASEILNHYSHQEYEVTVFIKDGYIELDTFRFINMSNVIITSHPDYQALGRRALVSVTKVPQPGISKKASFHLLKHTNINPNEALSAGDFGERELLEFSRGKAGFTVLRTGLEISNINFHSNDVEYFGLLIYLQHKTMKLNEAHFNVTGMVFYTKDPMNLYIENITSDTSRSSYFLEFTFLLCNYPEAATNNTVYIKNATPLLPTRMPSFRMNFIENHIPGNHSVSQIDCGGFPVDNNLGLCVFVALSYTCNPTDDIQQNFEIDTVSSDGRMIKAGLGVTFIVPYATEVPPYRPISIKLSNFTFDDITQQFMFGICTMFGAGSEVMSISGFKFHNILSNFPLMESTYFKAQEVRGVEIDDIYNYPAGLVKINAFENISISNITVRNFTDQKHYALHPISVIPSEYSVVVIEDLSFQNVELFSVPLMYIDSAPVAISVRNFIAKDMLTPNDQSLVSILNANSIYVSNITLENVWPIDQTSTSENIIGMANLNLGTEEKVEFEEFNIRNSSLSLFDIGTLVNDVKLSKNISFKNIRYLDCNINTSKALISTDDFVGNFNIFVVFSNLQFENISFKAAGSLIELNHQLLTSFEFSNVTIKGIISGSINSEGVPITSSLYTKFKFTDSVFYNITSKVLPFISTSKNSIFEIVNCSFIGLTSLSLISGIVASSDRSNVVIKDTLFQNNSAIVTAIFKVETEATTYCTNCTILNNFGETNGVFEIASGGTLEIYDSSMSANYAMKNAIGTLFSTYISSVISGTKIYSNKVISKSQMLEEVSGSCTNLCFLNAEMQSYLSKLDDNQIFDSEFLIEVLQAELHIINGTHIFDEISVMNTFSSTILFENIGITSIRFTQKPLLFRSTATTFKNVTIANCSADSSQGEFIFIQLTDGTLESSDLRVENSESMMIQLLFSHAILVNTQFTNISNRDQLIGVLGCHSLIINGLILTNYSTISDSVVGVQNTDNIELQNIKLTGQKNKLFVFDKSNITLIENVNIRNGMQPLEFIDSTLLKMTDCVFLNNTQINSNIGGAIKITDSQVFINNTSFDLNSAFSGGAIVFECTSMLHCELSIQNSFFKNNKATISGGAMYYNYNRPKIVGTIFVNNSAEYGPNYASYAARIGSLSNKNLTLDNIGSGVPLSSTLELTIFDIDGQIMNLDNSSQIIVLSEDNSKVSIKGVNAITVQSGTAQFSNIAVAKKPELSRSKLLLKSKSIDINKVREVLGSNFTQQLLQANFRSCQPGERILGDECYPCAAGTYSLHWNSTECEMCSLYADCLGTNQVSLKSGYWRRFQNSSKIAECINKEACKGGYDANNIYPTICKEGYTGNLCSQCAVNSTVKYERVNDYECRKCPDPFINAVRVLGAIFLVLAFYIFNVVINVKKTEESQLSVLLKILNNYLQLIAMSVSMTSNYPSAIIAITTPMTMSGGSADVLLSFDCFIKDSEVKFIFNSNKIFKLFLLMWMPIMLFIFMAIMWGIVRCIKPKWVKDIKRNLTVSLVCIIFLLHPKLAKESIDIFKCVEIDEEYRVTRIDTNIECFSSTHIKWCLLLAIPIMIIWVIACPLLAFIAIYRGRHSRQSKGMGYFIMLYQGLKPEVIYWEFINTAKKVSILLCLLFEIKVSICISIIILTISGRFQIWVKPYIKQENNILEFMATMGVIPMLIAALVYSQNDQNDTLDFILLISIIVINIRFLSEWIHSLLHLYHKKHKAVECLLYFVEKVLCKRKTNTYKDSTKNETNIKKVEEKVEKSLESEVLPRKKRTPKRLIRGKIKNKPILKPKKKANKHSMPGLKGKVPRGTKSSKAILPELKERVDENYEEAKIDTIKEHPTDSRVMDGELKMLTSKAVYIDADLSERGESN